MTTIDTDPNATGPNATGPNATEPERAGAGIVDQLSADTHALVDALVDLPLAPRDATYNLPPDDAEIWSYTEGHGRLFLVFSAFSKMCLGVALGFLSLQGQWLLMLLPFAVMVVLGSIISLVWATQVQPFDRAAHDRAVRRGPRSPGSVDVFITTCGEDAFVIEHTLWRAMMLDHPDVRVYVLDDKGSDEIRRYAEIWGATYHHRPNRGWMKKAGNLHHAYERSDGDYIVVLDADFAVRPDFLTHTLPYFDDPTIGILQTPQFFRVSRTNWVERGAAAQQEQFYRIGMRARDRRGGAICVGTNAVYRRSALDERGGMALLEHSEDLFTGMKVIDAGYRVSYLPVVLAAGSAPTTTQALASQQYRWARGNFALSSTPMFKRLQLSPMQRLSIWDGWIFYITSALSPVVAVLVPLLTLAEAPEAISFAPALWLVPSLLTEFVLQPRWLILNDGRASRRVGLISQIAHLDALRDHLTDREQEWIPTGGIQAGKHRQATDRIPDLISAGGLVAFLGTLALVGMRLSDGYSLVDLAPVVVLAMIALPTALAVTRRPDRRRVERPISVERDQLLDSVRALSIIRVLFWHALGFWWISWTFAAMPAVFYVSGAVFAKSVSRSTPWQVVRSRLRRLLPPYAMFVTVSLVAVFVAEPAILRTHLGDVVSWIVPYRSPAQLPWEDGWLSTPLWFLRALILVLLIVPLASKLAPRASRAAWAVMWCAALIGVDLALAQQSGETATAVWRGIGDLVCFGGFFAVGAAVHHRRWEIARIERVQLLVACVAVTAFATWVAPPTDLVVNNSNVSMALVGMCWLLVIALFEEPLRHFGSIAAVSRVLRWVTDRSMTVYLWHTLAICTTYALVGAPSGLTGSMIFSVVFVALLVSLVTATHPFESLGLGLGRRARASGSTDSTGNTGMRAPRWRMPLLLAPWLVVLTIATAQPSLFPTSADVVGPPAPSARPAVGDDGGADSSAAASPRVLAVGVAPGGGGASAASETSRAWLARHGVTTAAVVSLTGVTGEVRTDLLVPAGATSAADAADAVGGSGGSDSLATVPTLTGGEQFEVLSITKTMIAAVALQLVDEGVLTLDERLPPIDGLPLELTQGETLRRLLAHASGITDYRLAPGYRRDTTLTPIDAVRTAWSVSDPRDTTADYAATNYFVVGLLIEEVTGQQLATVLDERLFDPLGLDDTELVDNTRDGFVGFASGGVVSTLGDMVRWYDALLRRRVVLSSEMTDEMIWGGAEFGRDGGLGAWRSCPCGIAPDEAGPDEAGPDEAGPDEAGPDEAGPDEAGPDARSYAYVFHDGGDTRLLYLPARDLVVAVRFDVPFYGPDRIADGLDGFLYPALESLSQR